MAVNILVTLKEALIQGGQGLVYFPVTFKGQKRLLTIGA